jgi:hypothetical protein
MTDSKTTDTNTIDPKTVAHRYIDLWNERASERRREILSQNWADDAKYVDPLMSGDGREGVDALIAGSAAALSGFQISADRRAQRIRRPRPLLLGTGSRWRRQPDQGHGLRRAQGRPHPQYHRIPRSGPTGRLRGCEQKAATDQA